MTMAIQYLMWEIERVCDAFHRAVHTDRDVDAALALTRPDAELTNLPTGTGGRGADDLRRYLADDVLGHLPADLTFRRVSRTVDKFRLVEESIVGFTHDRELPWVLPGIAPTHRRAEVLAISIVTFRHSRITTDRTLSQIAAHRTLWDHTGLSAQLQGSTRGLDADPAIRRVGAG